MFSANMWGVHCCNTLAHGLVALGTATSFGFAIFKDLDLFNLNLLFIAGVRAFAVAAGSAGVIRIGVAAGSAAVLRIGCPCFSGSMGSEFQTVDIWVLRHSRN